MKKSFGVQNIVITVCSICLFTGYTAGRIVTSGIATGMEPLNLVHDEQLRTSVVHIDGIQNGQLVGSVEGNVRLFLDGEFMQTHADRSFSIPADVLFTNKVLVAVPEEMHFVASKRGKKYYAVDSAQGSRIVPANRVYFQTADAAEAAGYLP